MSRRQIKITKEQLETLQKRFQAFLKGETTIAADEAFQNAVQSYTEVGSQFLRNYYNIMVSAGFSPACQ